MEKHCPRARDLSRQDLMRTAGVDGMSRHNTAEFFFFFPMEKSFLSEAMFSTALADCGHFLTRFFLFCAAVVWHFKH